jgi:hypothetical protein
MFVETLVRVETGTGSWLCDERGPTTPWACAMLLWNDPIFWKPLDQSLADTLRKMERDTYLDRSNPSSSGSSSKEPRLAPRTIPGLASKLLTLEFDRER